MFINNTNIWPIYLKNIFQRRIGNKNKDSIFCIFFYFAFCNIFLKSKHWLLYGNNDEDPSNCFQYETFCVKKNMFKIRFQPMFRIVTCKLYLITEKWDPPNKTAIGLTVLNTMMFNFQSCLQMFIPFQVSKSDFINFQHS